MNPKEVASFFQPHALVVLNFTHDPIVILLLCQALDSSGMP